MRKFLYLTLLMGPIALIASAQISLGPSIVIPAAAVPVGTIAIWGNNTAPTGWLFLNGAAVSRSTYQGCYNVLGTTFGAGDGSTTFNLPDLRGRIPAGKDDMGGVSAANRLTSTTITSGATTLGNTGGAQTHTLTIAEMPSHNHSQTTSIAAGGVNSVGVGANSRASSTTDLLNVTGFTGSGSAHNNVQPTIILNFIIKCS